MMKKILTALIMLVANVALAQTFQVQNLQVNGTQNTVGAATFQTPIPVTSGGIGTGAASATALDNITGFSSTGFLTRTGAGAYSFQSLTNGITLGNLAQVAANTILANATGSIGNVTAFSMPSCSTSSSALNWTSGTGVTCNTSINAATLGSATFASPGPIGSTTPGTAAFTTLSSTSPPSLGTATIYPTVPTNAALQALSTVTTGTVTRLGFYATNDVPPLNYVASGSACSLNAGAGDNGSQVQSANSKCWLAVFPSSGYDVRQWGAKPDGVTSDTAAIQAAINYVAALSAGGSGGIVEFPVGNYGIDSTGLSVPAIIADFNGMILQGAGHGTSLIRLSGANAMMTVNGGRFTIRDITFNGNSVAGSGIIFNKSSFNDNVPSLVQNCAFVSMVTQGIYNQQGDALHIDHNYFLNAGTYALLSHNSFINSTFTNNVVQGSGGLYLDSNSNQAEGVSIIGNKILPTNSGGIGIYINFGLEIEITNNIIDQINTSGIVIHNNSSLIKLMGNWFGGGSSNQVGVFDNSNGIFVQNNTFSGGSTTQLLMNSASLGNINSVTVMGNYNYLINSSSYGMQFGLVKRATIVGNVMPGATGTGSIFWGAGNTGTIYGVLANNVLWTAASVDNTVTVSNTIVP